MNVDILLSLKNKIDTFSYSVNSKGKDITGIEAVRYAVVDNYLKELTELGLSERYIKDQINDLYKKLETVEEQNILDKPQFNFTCSEDVTYYILKSLNISYEDVMENDFGHFRAKSEYDKLNDKMDQMVEAFSNLSDTVYICNKRPGRTNFADKVIDFNVIFSSISYCNSRITVIDTLNGDNKTFSENQLKTQLLSEMFRMCNMFYNYPLIQNLLSKPIPLELMLLQYFQLYKESKKTLTDKALENIKDSTTKTKYYDDLFKKIDNEINVIIEEKNWAKKDSPSEAFSMTELEELDTNESRLAHYNNRLNYYRYSCTVCLFDFINRTSREFTIAAFNNFSYMSSKKFKDSVNKTINFISIPPYLKKFNSWHEFFGESINQANITLRKQAVRANVDELKEFTKTIGSKLHQLAVYLERINLRNYSNEVLSEMQNMFSKYLEIISKVIFIYNWNINDDIRKKMNELEDALDAHSIIVGHDMGGIDDNL